MLDTVFDSVTMKDLMTMKSLAIVANVTKKSLATTSLLAASLPKNRVATV